MNFITEDDYGKRAQQRREHNVKARAEKWERDAAELSEVKKLLDGKAKELRKLKWIVAAVVVAPAIYMLFFPPDQDMFWLVYLESMLWGIIVYHFYQNTYGVKEYKRNLRWYESRYKEHKARSTD